MPALSSTMTEGRISSWLKGVGDKVDAGDMVLAVAATAARQLQNCKKNWKSNRQKKLSCRSVRKKRCSVPKSWKPESKNSRRVAAAAVVVKVAAAAAAVPTQPRWLS